MGFVLPVMQSIITSSPKTREIIVSVVQAMTSGKESDTATAPRFKIGGKKDKNDILLLEDSPIMKNFYQNMLEKNSFTVYTAAEEESAVDLAANNKPRLVLIDDAGNSNKAAKIAKSFRKDQRTKGIPLLLMLPADVFRNIHSKVKPYVDMCIPKTFTPAILMPSLQSLLSS